jgi:hypothetical protein
MPTPYIDYILTDKSVKGYVSTINRVSNGSTESHLNYIQLVINSIASFETRFGFLRNYQKFISCTISMDNRSRV